MAKQSNARKGSNEWKLFLYWQTHKIVSSRDSKYPPLVIMDLPKLVSDLVKRGYHISKKRCAGEDQYGNKRYWTEYTLNEEVEINV